MRIAARNALAAFLAAGLLLPSASSADKSAPRIEMTPSSTTVGLGEVFNVLVRVVTEDTSVQSVTLPAFTGFDVVSKSVSSPIQVHFGFGTGSGGLKTTHTREYDLWLKSKKPGKYTFDAVVVKWKGKEYKGRPVTVTVTNKPPKQTSVPQPSSPFPDLDWPFKMPGPGFPQPQPQPVPQPQPQPVPFPGDAGTQDSTPVLPEDLEGAEYDPELFLQTVVEPEEAVIGQQMTLTLYLYTAVNLGTWDLTTEPGTDKFWVKDLLPPAAKPSTAVKVVQGKTFEVLVLRKVALFPTEAGTITISPAELKSTQIFGGLFGGGGERVRTAVPVEVTVHPLPAEGRPKDFVTSSVGAYSIKGTLVPEETLVNQPVTFTIALEGTGNIEMLAAPAIMLPDEVKTYDPQVSDLVSLKEGTVGGTKKIEYMLIPTKPGELIIGPFEWPFYNPERGIYERLEIPASVLQVDPAGPDEAEESVQAVVPEDETGERLRPIRTVAALRSSREQMVRNPWFLVLVIFPPGLLALIYLVAFSRSFARGMRTRNPAGAAFKEARAVLRKAGGSGDHGEFYAEVQRAIYQYLETRFCIPATGMTGPELMAALVAVGVSSEDADETVKETENCEFARYGRSSSERNLDMSEVRARVISILEKLEKYEPPRRKEEKP
jgi:hypothetical protein